MRVDSQVEHEHAPKGAVPYQPGGAEPQEVEHMRLPQSRQEWRMDVGADVRGGALMIDVRLLTVKQLSAAMGMSEAELSNLAKCYNVPTIIMRGRPYLNILRIKEAKRRRDRDR